MIPLLSKKQPTNPAWISDLQNCCPSARYGHGCEYEGPTEPPICSKSQVEWCSSYSCLLLKTNKQKKTRNLLFNSGSRYIGVWYGDFSPLGDTLYTYTGCHSEPQEEDTNCIYRIMPNRLPSTELILELKVRSIILQTKPVIREKKVNKNV